MPVRHVYISSKPDSADSTKVRASNWNDAHIVDIFVDDETPIGVIDGINAVFNLTSAPVPSTSLKLYVNGTLYKRGVAYNLSGATITFTPDYVPQVGFILSADFRKD